MILPLLCLSTNTAHNNIYHDFVTALHIQPETVQRIEDIPFLPVSFFKSHKVVCGNKLTPLFLKVVAPLVVLIVAII